MLEGRLRTRLDIKNKLVTVYSVDSLFLVTEITLGMALSLVLLIFLALLCRVK